MLIEILLNPKYQLKDIIFSLNLIYHFVFILYIRNKTSLFLNSLNDNAVFLLEARTYYQDFSQ